MKHHFLHYMDQVIHNRWRDVAFVDYGEKTQYTHGEVAQQVRRFHKLFRIVTCSTIKIITTILSINIIPCMW